MVTQTKEVAVQMVRNGQIQEVFRMDVAGLNI